MNFINKYIRSTFKKYVAPATISLFALGSVVCADSNVNVVGSLNSSLPYDSLRSRITVIDMGGEVKKNSIEKKIFTHLEEFRTKFAEYISDAYVSPEECECISEGYINFKNSLSEYDKYCKKSEKINDIMDKLRDKSGLTDKELEWYSLFYNNSHGWDLGVPEAEKFGRKLGYNINVDTFSENKIRGLMLCVALAGLLGISVYGSIKSHKSNKD